MQQKIKALEEQVTSLQQQLAQKVSTLGPATPQYLPTPRVALVIGIVAVLWLISWLDFRIGSGLSGSQSNQVAWAFWLLVSVPLAFWLSIYWRAGWFWGMCAALARSLEKTFVMAYCWSQSFHHGLDHQLTQSNLWTQIFVPELSVFVAAFWLGKWFVAKGHSEQHGDYKSGFDGIVQRLNALISALAPVLGLLSGASGVVAAMLSKK